MQEILGLVRRCVEDYDMIQAGDTVAVGVSGGKDSLLTLTALARLSRFYPKPFRVVAMTIEAGTPGMSFDGVADYCRALGVEYIRVSVPIYEVVFLERREKNPCSLCAKLRRGALSTAMNEHGIRKIALGHHYDDAVETMLMSLIFEGRLGCFQPVTYLSRTDVTQIRPLLYVKERQVVNAAKRLEPSWRIPAPPTAKRAGRRSRSSLPRSRGAIPTSSRRSSARCSATRSTAGAAAARTNEKAARRRPLRKYVG